MAGNLERPLVYVAALLEVVQYCVKRVEESRLGVEEAAYRYASQQFGLLFLSLSFYSGEQTERLLGHWSRHAQEKCEQLIKRVRDERRNTITYRDVFTIMTKAPAPATTDPTTSQNPATAGYEFTG